MKKKRINDTPVIRIDLPAAQVYGLHFNEQTVFTTFDCRDTGDEIVFVCNDIMFMSAISSDTVDDGKLHWLRLTEPQALLEYLNSKNVTYAFQKALLADNPEHEVRVAVSLLVEPDGVKQYNGAVADYWLQDRLIDDELPFHWKAACITGIVSSGDEGNRRFTPKVEVDSYDMCTVHGVAPVVTVTYE